MPQPDFTATERNHWAIDIELILPDTPKSQMKKTMKQAGMRSDHDIGEWFMQDFDIEKFESWYLFSIQLYQDDILYSRANQTAVQHINRLLISRYLATSVSHAANARFCQWLRQLCVQTHCTALRLRQDAQVDSADALEQWLTAMADYLEAKYHPHGIMGSEILG